MSVVIVSEIDPVRVITEKRDGGEHAPQLIRNWIEGYASGTVDNEQMAAWAMAVLLNGMTAEETACLTEAMWNSGITLQWESRDMPYVDKHSTGGIGDKTSLILAPLLACCGVKVPMLSGRGLGITGGTLDKLESIPDFRTDLSEPEIMQIVDRVGCVITGTTKQIAVADRKLYALRDITGTIASIPLITASIMSKKLAENLDGLVLDVKFGSGAFMSDLEQARNLAKSLVETGCRVNVATTALITDMNQPLGRMIGNALEVNESMAVLEGGGPLDLRELTLRLGAEVLMTTGVAESSDVAMQVVTDALDQGLALERMEQMVSAQGGALDAQRTVAQPEELLADKTGYVQRIDGEALGYAVIALGGGRRKLGQAIDHSVGLEILTRIGDRIESNEPWICVFAQDQGRDEANQLLKSAIQIGDEPVQPPALVVDRVVGTGE